MDSLADTPALFAIGGILTIAGGIAITSAVRNVVGAALLVGGLLLFATAVGIWIREPAGFGD